VVSFQLAQPALRQFLQTCYRIIVLRIEIQAESLHGADRPEVMRLLHEITAEVEKEAIRAINVRLRCRCWQTDAGCRLVNQPVHNE